MDESTISTGKAAKICGVTSDTVLKWIKRGHIEAQRTPGGHYRIKTASLAPFRTDPTALSNTDNTIKKTAFCWEYHSDDGSVKSGCRSCMVFQAKAQHCYMLAGIGANEGMHCAENCDTCPYFQYIDQLRYNVLLITDNSSLQTTITKQISETYALRFASSGYEAAMLIQQFHPDYVVLDDSMKNIKTDEITRHMVKDLRLEGVQIILAVDHSLVDQKLQDGVCASLQLPITAKLLEDCFQNLRIRLLGLQH
jgi:excisionase family DNA binding protein